MWKFYALLSAVFAALTAILAKVGVKGATPTWLRRSEWLLSC